MTSKTNNIEKQWDLVIGSKNRLISVDLREVWRYRDLLRMFVKRDFVTYYKQTILGPIWFFIQPIFTTITYVLIFGKVAGLSTDGSPQILFYLAGVTAWNYFADCLNKISTVFKDNQATFGKVYFPRLVVPLSSVLSNLLKFGIQLGLFLLTWCYYYFFENSQIQIQIEVLLIPILIMLMASLGLSMGMIISALTTKYRDLIFLLQFGIQLFMYVTPVIYPLSSIPAQHQWILKLNPMTGILEGFRYVFLGTGSFSHTLLGYTSVVTLVLLLFGVLIFNRTEKNFMDTV